MFMDNKYLCFGVSRNVWAFDGKTENSEQFIGLDILQMDPSITILKTAGVQKVNFAVDTADVPKINKYDWCLGSNGAIESDIPNPFWLANYIMDAMNDEYMSPQEKKYVEFIDGNYYNLIRRNLKVHSCQSYIDANDGKYVIAPHTLSWKTSGNQESYKMVRYKFREGYGRNIPTYMWKPSQYDALEQLVKTSIWVPYEGDYKQKYDEFHRILKQGASYRE